MSSRVHKTHSHLRRVLASLAGEGYDLAGLVADAPRDVIAWCDGVLGETEPKQHKGHGLSRLDARSTVDEVQHLRGCAFSFVHALNQSVKQHEQAITAHNRRAREHGRQLRAKKVRQK